MRRARARDAMLAFFYTCAFVCAAWLPFVWHHREIHGVVSVTHCALTLFNAVNLLICLWENALFIHRAKVRRVYLRFKKQVGDRNFPSPLCLFENITLRQALSYEYWSVIWSTYSLLDPSYSDQKSFGFWIDSGNGVVTVAPTLLLSWFATWDALPLGLGTLSPRFIGALGMTFNWQMLYGTLLYFGNYVLSGYHRGTSATYVAVVCVANGIWIAFPAWWIWVCWGIVESNSFASLRT